VLFISAFFAGAALLPNLLTFICRLLQIFYFPAYSPVSSFRFIIICSFFLHISKIDIMKIASLSDKIFEQRINHLSTAKDE